MKKIFRVRHSYTIMGFLVGLLTGNFIDAYPSGAQPTLSRVYSNRFTPQVQQYNDAGLLGTLNPNYGTDGSVNVGTTFYQGYQNKSMVTLPNGSMYVLLDGGTGTNNSLVTMYDALGVVQTGFNSPYGYVTLTGRPGANSITMDAQGRILMCGGAAASTQGWFIRMDPANDPSDYQQFDGTTSYIGAIAQQSTGNYISVGQSAPDVNSSVYSQIIRYLDNGSIDTSFGPYGQILFDGSIWNGVDGFLYSTLGILNCAIDADDNIYVAYVDGSTQQANLVKFDVDGVLVDYRANIINDDFDSYVINNNQLYVNLDLQSPQNVIVAGTLAGTPSIVDVAAYQANDFSSRYIDPTMISSADSLEIADLVALQNGYFAVVSNNATNFSVRVDQLKKYGSNAVADQNFNAQATPGYIEFQIDDSHTFVYGTAVSQDGQLYLANATSVMGFYNPYISQIFDYPYILQVPQFPVTKLQGDFDLTFGAPSGVGYPLKQQFLGVDFIYNGNFGQILNQETVNIIEISGGYLLAGSYGLVQGDEDQSMMLTWLYPDGTLADQRTLQNDTNNDEWMAAFAVGASSKIYVACASEDGDTSTAYLRSYYSNGLQDWSTLVSNDALCTGLAIQGSDGILVFGVSSDYSVGFIARYTTEGALDTTFHAGGEFAGVIVWDDFLLNMGQPVWGGGLVRTSDRAIFVAYLDRDNGYINVAGILRDGSGLLPGFGDAGAGIVYNIFDFIHGEVPGGLDFAMAFDDQNDIIIGVSSYEEGSFGVTRISSINGAIDPRFNNGEILYLEVPNASSLDLYNIVGMSNGKFMMMGSNYSDANPLMLLLRVTNTGELDATFNPEGDYPGILQFQIQNEQYANYSDRELVGLAIQSSQGNLGNLVCAGYEVMQSDPTAATPEVFRIFGQPRTTQVQRFPIQDQYPGILDTSLNDCGGFNLNDFIGDNDYAQGKVIYSYPSETPYDGMLLVGMDVDNGVQIVRFNHSSLTLDPTFGDNGVYSISDVTGINNIIVDNDLRIVACGTMPVEGGSQGWALYCDQDGQDYPVFFNVPTSIVAANMIYQQRSGRFMIAGSYQESSDEYPMGTLIAFQDRLVQGLDQLQVDFTFNIVEANGSPQGQYNIPSTPGLYNLVINDDDTMFIAYQDSSNLQGVNYDQYGVSILKILADGSRFAQNFNYGNGAIQTTLIPDTPNVISCITDTDDNIIVAVSSNNTLQLLRFYFGGVAYPFNPTQGTTPSQVATYLIPTSDNILVVPSTLMGTAGVALTDMLGTATWLDDVTNGLILLGTNTANGNYLVNYGNLFAVRLVINGENDGDLDPTWNPYPGDYPVTTPNVPGVTTYGQAFDDAIDSVPVPAVLQWNGAIDIGGNLWTAGASYNGSNTTPTLIKIVGYPYLSEISQTQFEEASGIQDDTVWDNVPGYIGAVSLLNLNQSSDDPVFNQLVEYNTVNRLYINQQDGSFVISSVNGGNGVSIASINAPLSQSDSLSFTPAISGTAIVNDLFVANGYAQNGDQLSTGTINGVMWAAVNDVVLPSVQYWTYGSAIRQAVNGDTLVAGYDSDPTLNASNGAGAIVAFLPNNTQIDAMFGNQIPRNGIYATGSTYPIADMAIDNFSRIYIAYLDSSSYDIIIQRLLPNGSGVDTTFGQENEGNPWGVVFPSATIDGYNPLQIRMALDQANNQLVVAAQDGGESRGNGITVARYSTLDGSSTGWYQSIQLGSGGDAAILDLLNVEINTAQQIYVVAYNNSDRPSGGYQTVVARFNSVNENTSINLDSTYAADAGGESSAGIAAVNVGMQTFAGALDPDRRMYLVGNDGDYAYIARLFGNNYYLAVEQANEGVVLGELDTTYGYDGTTVTLAGGAVGGQLASTILPTKTGSNIIVTVSNIDFDIESEGTWTVQLLSDGSPDVNYGGGQGVQVAALPGFEFTRNMILDGYGNSVTCGVNVNNSDLPVGFIKSILPNGSMNTAFGGQNGNPAGTVYFSNELFVVDAIAQLSNGNYVFAGTDNTFNNGILGMISPTGVPVTTFGTNGLVKIGVTLSAISVDDLNNIYVAGGDQDNNAFVAKYNSAGRLVRSFGNNGIAANVLTHLSNTADIIYVEMVLDGAGNIVVTGATHGEQHIALQIVRLTPAGLIDPTFDQLTTVSGDTDIDDFIPTSLIALDNGNYLVGGFKEDDDGSDEDEYNEFIIAILPDGSLDTNFNPLGQDPGIGLYHVLRGTGDNLRDGLNISVQQNGQILLAGSETDDDGVFYPITLRVNGYPGTHAIRQFPPLAASDGNDLNKQYGDQGLSYSGMISNLINGGSTAVDSRGRIVISGITSDGNVVAVRFTSFGVLDPLFGTDGIASAAVNHIDITGNCYVTVDRNDNVLVGCYSSEDSTLKVVKFKHLDGAIDTTFGTAGIATSNPIQYLSYGGFITTDGNDSIVVGGKAVSADPVNFYLVAARFLSNGDIDTDFGTAGIATTNNISTLVDGGFIVADSGGGVYLGGYTTQSQLLIAKFNNLGGIDNSFNGTGIATTPAYNLDSCITGLVAGGPVALDSNLNIVVGGYTSNQQFVAARFTPAGHLDLDFNNGIAYSPELFNISGCAGVCVDSNNNIIIGGSSVASDNVSVSMMVARLTPAGQVDTVFNVFGTGTSGAIDGLALNSGFVAVNQLGNPIAGGFDNITPQLVVGEFYSGAEIVVTNTARLPIATYKIYWYGNNPEIFQDFFAMRVIANRHIVNTDVKEAVLTAVSNSLDSFADYVVNGPNSGIILAACVTPIWDGSLAALLAVLVNEFPDSEADIRAFFTELGTRILQVHNVMLTGAAN